MPGGGDARGASTEVIVQAVLKQLEAQGRLADMPRGAVRGRPGGDRGSRGEDWTCPRKACGFLNFARRQSCRECGLSRKGTQSGQRGQPPARSIASTSGSSGGGSGGGGGGGVSAGRTYAMAARKPAQLHEFIRRPGERPTDCMPARQNLQQGDKTSWADISEDDPSTVVGKNLLQREGEEFVDKKGNEDTSPEVADAKGDDDDLEGLRAKLAKRKEVVDFLARQGYGENEVTLVSARKEVEELTAKITALDPKKEKPFEIALLHAQRALNRANAARSKLDTALEEINREYEERLDQHAEKVVAADERVALHSRRVAELKEQIGPRPPPRELGGNLLGAASSIQECSSTLAVVFELAQANPAYNEHVGKVEGCKSLLNKLHKLLVDSGGALRQDAEATQPEAVVQQPKDDDGAMDDDDDELRSQADSHGNPLQVEPPPPPAATQMVPPAEPAAASPGAQQQQAECGPPAQQQQQQPQQPPTPPAVPPASSPQPTGAVEKARAEIGAVPAVAKNREKIKAGASSKVRNDKTKGTRHSATAVGGATAPTPIRMVDTSEQAQEGGLIVDEDGSGAI